MSKHTPGPWHWVNSQTDKPFDFDAEWDGMGFPSLRTVAEREKYANARWELPAWILNAEPMQFGNDAANARLIAAAPCLLEALQACRAQWIHSVNADQCLAAISKATGENQ